MMLVFMGKYMCNKCGNVFRNGLVQPNGTAIAKILPLVSLFTAEQSRGEKHETVLDKLTAFFNISNSKLSQ